MSLSPGLRVSVRKEYLVAAQSENALSGKLRYVSRSTVCQTQQPRIKGALVNVH